MSTVAILADIHGNVPALEAVLDDLDRLAPDEVLVGGDLVGRGPEGSRVVQQIRDRGWPSIQGNHEQYLLDFRHRRVPDNWWREEQWAASRWMAAELDSRSVAYIESLPFSERPRSAPGLLLIHGSPRSLHDGLGPWSSDAELERHLAEIGESFLVCGHTHRAMHRKLAAGEVVNVGSVGLPFNGDRRAQYGLFRWDGERWHTELRQVAYEVERTRRIYRQSGFLDEGGVTARLLDLELQHAAPFVVPFLRWAKVRGHRPEGDRIPEFLELYDSSGSLREFFRLLSTTAPVAGR